MASVMERLRAETRDEHAAIERMVLATGFCEVRSRYVAWLRRTLGFYRVVEDELARSVELAAELADLSERRKAPWIARDLHALGEAGALEDLALVDARAGVSGPAAFGCAYVLEGATLGGRVLGARVRASLGIDAGSGASFLAGYGSGTKAKWRAFGEAAERYASRGASADAMVAGARDTFDRMHAWLAGM